MFKKSKTIEVSINKAINKEKSVKNENIRNTLLIISFFNPSSRTHNGFKIIIERLWNKLLEGKRNESRIQKGKK